MQTNNRYSDPYGRVVVRSDAVFDLLYKGQDFADLLVDETEEIQEYNHWCKVYEHSHWLLKSSEPLSIPPEDFHKRNTECWKMPDELLSLDVRDMALALCRTVEQRDRVEMEMDLFEQHKLIPMLQFLLYMADALRQHGIFWGCGRGSSTASYVLFLLGIHKVDSLKYHLPISEFLR